VMLETEIEFTNAQGSAVNFLSDGNFNLDAFAAGWQNRKVLALLQPIATRELGIADLDQHEALKNVLLRAYELGKEAAARPE